MMEICNILFAICLINVPLVTCSRILVLFYHPGPSHFHSFYPLFNELAERGHNVTVVTYTHVEDTHPNYNELLLSDIPVINASLTYDSMVSVRVSIKSVINYHYFRVQNYSAIVFFLATT